jgi:hypothetical protein
MKLTSTINTFQVLKKSGRQFRNRPENVQRYFPNHLKSLYKDLTEDKFQPTGIMYCIFKKYAAGILQNKADESIAEIWFFSGLSV